MGVFSSSPIQVTPALPQLGETPKGERCALLVIGVCRSWTGPRFAKFLSRYSLKFKKVQKSRGEDYAVLDFDSGEDRLTAYNFLHGCQVSDEVFDVKPYYEYDPPPMPYATQAEIMKFSKIATQTVFQRMYPFKNKSTDERISRKLLDCKNFLKEVYSEPIKVITSPNTFPAHYRIDFNIGYDDNGKVTVGFNTSSRVNTTIIPASTSFNIPEKALQIAKDFQEYVEKNIFPPFDRETKTGKWKKISVRVATTGQIMVTISTIGNLPLSEVEALEDLFEKRADSVYLLKGDSADTSKHSCVVEADINSPQHAICGAQFILDKINELSFTIYPFTIFPYNFFIFSKIIESIKENAKLDENTVIVDLCCGIGTNCLCLSPFVKRTIGIDSQEKNIFNAMKNAEENKIMNSYFVHGSGSTVIDIANNIPSSERVIFLLDTTNVGPHNELTQQISRCHNVSMVIYITNAPETLGYELRRNLKGMNLSLTELYDEDPLTYDVKLLSFLTPID